jgi:NADPH2:quinone reductase
MVTSVEITEYGDTDKLAITEATGQAEPGDGQVLIRVTAASINRMDAAVAAGYVSEVFPLKLPVTIGGDFSGTVVRTGLGADNVAVGEKVIGNAGVTLGGSGSFADHTIAPARLVAKAPTSIDPAAAAALPLVGASAVQGLQTLEAGQGTTVLILGGAGAVGSVAVQLAKHAGATVLASASAGDREYVSSLGADEVYDYKDSAWLRQVSGVDGILDATTGVDGAAYYKLLKPGGRMVSLTTQHSPEAAEADGVEATTQMTQPTTEILTELVRLVDQGVVRQRITGTFPITKVHEAFASDNQNGGKTVITLQ